MSKNIRFDGTRPNGYPKIDITYKDFVSRLNDILTEPIKSESSLNRLYIEYKETQYATKLDYVQNNGYETVEEWAGWFLQDWTTDETGTQLKPKTAKEVENG